MESIFGFDWISHDDIMRGMDRVYRVDGRKAATNATNRTRMGRTTTRRGGPPRPTGRETAGPANEIRGYNGDGVRKKVFVAWAQLGRFSKTRFLPNKPKLVGSRMETHVTARQELMDFETAKNRWVCLHYSGSKCVGLWIGRQLN